MKKKKIVALLVAGIMTVGVVGGTLAWFTSNDSVTNVFNTGKTGDADDLNAGIEVEENFSHPGLDGILGTGDDVIASTKNGPDGKNQIVTLNTQVLPGDLMKKEASVFSTADYNQFVRAKVTKTWRLAVDQASSEDTGAEEIKAGQVITQYKVIDDKVVIYGTGEVGEGWTALNYDKLKVTLADFGTSVEDSWSESVNGYYYYNQILEPEAHTSDLLKKVEFVAGNDDNVYKNLTFEVKVEAESVQASNGAAGDLGWDSEVPAASITGYKTQTANN